jgi:hypothetical protein
MVHGVEAADAAEAMRHVGQALNMTDDEIAATLVASATN